MAASGGTWIKGGTAGNIKGVQTFASRRAIQTTARVSGIGLHEVTDRIKGGDGTIVTEVVRQQAATNRKLPKLSQPSGAAGIYLKGDTVSQPDVSRSLFTSATHHAYALKNGQNVITDGNGKIVGITAKPVHAKQGAQNQAAKVAGITSQSVARTPAASPTQPAPIVAPTIPASFKKGDAFIAQASSRILYDDGKGHQAHITSTGQNIFVRNGQVAGILGQPVHARQAAEKAGGKNNNLVPAVNRKSGVVSASNQPVATPPSVINPTTTASPVQTPIAAPAPTTSAPSSLPRSRRPRGTSGGASPASATPPPTAPVALPAAVGQPAFRIVRHPSAASHEQAMMGGFTSLRLTPSERSAVVDYVDNSYYQPINRKLRGIKEEHPLFTNSMAKQRVDAHIQAMDSMMSRSPGVPENTVAWRAVRSSGDVHGFFSKHYTQFEKDFDSWKPGDVKVDRGFTSLSVNKKKIEGGQFLAGNQKRIVLEYRIPKGAKSVYMNAVYHSPKFGDMAELLMNRDLPFRVISKSVDPDGTKRAVVEFI